ncbi:MAG TPA: hypothetical protein VII94_00605 [Candidatus Saccharimonadales bacterium]
MTLTEFETLSLIETKPSDEKDEEYSIPLDISDIINICKDFNSLGWHIQNQIENILEVGVEESIKSGHVKQQSLPHIKHFLRRICGNVYFGDAAVQAEDCLKLIRYYEDKYQIQYVSNYN